MLALKCSIQAVLCRNNYIESSSQMQPQNHSMWYSECSITKATIPFFKCEFIKCIMRNCTESESKHQYAIKCTFYNKYMGFYTYVLRYEREVLAMSPICHLCKNKLLLLLHYMSQMGKRWGIVETSLFTQFACYSAIECQFHAFSIERTYYSSLETKIIHCHIQPLLVLAGYILKIISR